MRRQDVISMLLSAKLANCNNFTMAWCGGADMEELDINNTIYLLEFTEH